MFKRLRLLVKSPKAAPQPTIRYKRRWKEELYELFFKHILSIDNYDTRGLTEKLTLAWLTPTARKLRAQFKACWGPYGVLLKQSQTRGGFFAGLGLELGATLTALALVSLLWCQLSLVFIPYPRVEFWDIECGPESGGET